MSESTTTIDYVPILAQIESLPCRCCMQSQLRAFVQHGLPGDETIFVDCRNPSCALYQVTRSFKSWITFDLTVWYTAEDPAWLPTIVEAANSPRPEGEGLGVRVSGGEGAPATLRTLVETFIAEHEKDYAAIVMRDFGEQLACTLPYRRRALCEAWLHIYTRG